jgi:hypothetical protein
MRANFVLCKTLGFNYLMAAKGLNKAIFHFILVGSTSVPDNQHEWK